MSDSGKNRVLSAKTSRGSRNPSTDAGHDGILQPAQPEMQPHVIVEDVKRVVEVGKLLRSVLTPEEIVSLRSVLNKSSRAA